MGSRMSRDIKYISLERLEQIQSANYLGMNGYDYNPSEIDRMINEKRSRLDIGSHKSMLRHLQVDDVALDNHLAFKEMREALSASELTTDLIARFKGQFPSWHECPVFNRLIDSICLRYINQ